MQRDSEFGVLVLSAIFAYKMNSLTSTRLFVLCWIYFHPGLYSGFRRLLSFKQNTNLEFKRILCGKAKEAKTSINW